jgi:peptidoglycan biosynthesis protein MviN/MurJ (putative lipid II flippase)
MNLCMIAAALWWAPYFAVPITAMAWAILISGVLQLVVQLPALKLRVERSMLGRLMGGPPGCGSAVFDSSA